MYSSRKSFINKNIKEIYPMMEHALVQNINVY
jgi:hypothetical protein